ncbi:MAG: polymer-forming cytoskeletal protein [Nitrospinota bacterium]
MAKDSPHSDSSDRSIIGRSIRIRGNLEGDEDLTFLGRLEGQLNLKGRHLSVGEGANVKADIRARAVSVSGTVSGKIEATERMAIHSGGNVSGEILTPRLATEDGSILGGRFVVGLSPDADAASIPDFESLREMLEAELKGLTEKQLNFSAESPSWARWSIRRQVSHMANSVIFWLVGRWKDTLWKDRQPNAELVDISKGEHGHDRMLDPEKYRDFKTLLRMLRRSYDLIREVASRESAQSLSRRKLVLQLSPDAKLGTSNESAHELWSKFSQVHNDDIVQDKKDPNTWIFTLEATLRHLYYEHLAHVRTVQRLKALQELKTQVTLPRVGYLTFEEYWAD